MLATTTSTSPFTIGDKIFFPSNADRKKAERTAELLSLWTGVKFTVVIKGQSSKQ